jgi:hypothetical protein
MRIIAVLAFLIVLGGCTTYAPVEGVFVIGTDKTMTDHVISLSSGKNCSTVRKEKGLTYCEEDEPKIKQNIFCYKTLATVTCYDRPDPNPGRKRVDLNEHNLAK